MTKLLSTHIRHGDLVVDMDSSGDVQIVRQSTGQAIRLSLSEWEYLMIVAGLHGHPVCAPADPRTDLGEHGT